MIPSTYFASMGVEHVIFHDIPKKTSSGTAAPVLADSVTEINIARANMLKSRLTRTLTAKSAYDIIFNEETSSPVPDDVITFTNQRYSERQFVEMSQRFARYLFEQQTGQMSAGLLCVMSVAIGSRKAIAILKLEREQGVDLTLESTGGRRQFSMSLLDNLVFTDGTKLYKSSLFVNEDNDDYRAVACDNQKAVLSSKDMGQFWLRFLGCRVTVEPRVATQLWFDATYSYVNEFVADPVMKHDIYTHLISEMNSNRTTVTPGNFIEDYMPPEHRQRYREYLEETGVGLQRFNKDTSDIAPKLRKKSLYTRNGVSVTVPEGEEALVEIREQDILVSDILDSIVTQ